MTFDRYVLSMFEIADLWSDTVEELDYVILLNKIYRRITKPGRPKGSRPRPKTAESASATSFIRRKPEKDDRSGGKPKSLGFGSGASRSLKAPPKPLPPPPPPPPRLRPTAQAVVATVGGLGRPPPRIRKGPPRQLEPLLG